MEKKDTANKPENQRRKSAPTADEQKRTFARRYLPGSKKGQLMWHAIKSSFEEHLLLHLKAPSKHEDREKICKVQFLSFEVCCIPPSALCTRL